MKRSFLLQCFLLNVCIWFAQTNTKYPFNLHFLQMSGFPDTGKIDGDEVVQVYIKTRQIRTDLLKPCVHLEG